MAVAYQDRVVGKTHPYPIRHTYQIRRVKIDFTVDVQFLQRPFHRQCPFSYALKADKLVGNKSVHVVQREAVHLQRGIQRPDPLALISTREDADLLSVLRDDAIHTMRSVPFRHIHELCPDISHRTVLIDELLDGHIGRHGEVAGRLYDVIVAVEHARYIRCERQDSEQPAQFKVVHGNRDILQRGAVGILCRDEQARPVRRLKTQVGRQAAVTSDIDIVGIVDGKRLVAQDRLWRSDRQLYATTLHRSLQSQIKSGLPLVVKDGSMGLQAMLVQHATQIAVIRIGVLRAVVHCQRIIDLTVYACDIGPDAVKMHIIIYE